MAPIRLAAKNTLNSVTVSGLYGGFNQNPMNRFGCKFHHAVKNTAATANPNVMRSSIGSKATRY